jgi:hypothetical protein
MWKMGGACSEKCPLASLNDRRRSCISTIVSRGMGNSIATVGGRPPGHRKGKTWGYRVWTGGSQFVSSSMPTMPALRSRRSERLAGSPTWLRHPAMASRPQACPSGRETYTPLVARLSKRRGCLGHASSAHIVRNQPARIH